MSSFRALFASPSRLPLLALVLVSGACASGEKKEVDPVDKLPVIERIDRESWRPKLSVSVHDSVPDGVVPEGLLARAIGDTNQRPIDQLLKTFIVALNHTERFAIVDESEADYLFTLAVRELSVETEKDLSTMESMELKFMGKRLNATALLAGALYDANGTQIGATYEQLGRYELHEGKVFGDGEDEFLDLLGMGSSFSKKNNPGLANAVQKAIVKLVNDIANGTRERRPSGEARKKDADQ